VSSKSNKNVGVAALLLSSAISITVGIPVMLFAAYVMVEIWGWWGVRYGFPPLPFWTAVAIDFIAALVRGPTRDLVHHAEGEAIYEEAAGDIEFLVSSTWWMLKLRGGVFAFILITWGVAFFMHRVLE